MRRRDSFEIPVKPNFVFEQALWRAGCKFVGGFDEAGRGALAGPVTAGVIIFPPGFDESECLDGVRDSKQMSPAARQDWEERLKTLALGWAVGWASSEEIDRFGIVPATRLAVRRSLESLTFSLDHLLTDYLRLPEVSIPQTPLVKGDARSLSIAGASILAKTARDAYLRDLDSRYPGYGFARHKGYGTPQHKQALERLGPCPEHRRSFAPLRSIF